MCFGVAEFVVYVLDKTIARCVYTSLKPKHLKTLILGLLSLIMLQAFWLIMFQWHQRQRSRRWEAGSCYWFGKHYIQEPWCSCIDHQLSVLTSKYLFSFRNKKVIICKWLSKLPWKFNNVSPVLLPGTSCKMLHLAYARILRGRLETRLPFLRESN